jgi:uncharacterized SAM-binding protein YcdF (DUF218 family)
MLYFIKFIYSTFLLPPGILIVMLVLLGVWLFHKKYRSSSVILLGITLLFYLSANPFSGNRLIHTLEQRYQPPASVQGDVVVMLGGGAILDSPNLHCRGHVSGAAANRLLTCIQLYRQLQLPVIVSGGQVYKNTGREAEIARQILNDAGIVHDKIIVENRSLNTSENAAYTKLILERHHFRRSILVTSAFHMPRAVKQFQKAGIEVIPYPTDFRTNARYRFILDDLIPSADAFNNFSLALKEYIGLFVAKWY